MERGVWLRTCSCLRACTLWDLTGLSWTGWFRQAAFSLEIGAEPIGCSLGRQTDTHCASSVVQLTSPASWSSNMMEIILSLWGAGRGSTGATTSLKDGLLQVDSTSLLLFSEDLLGSERLLDLCLLGDVLVSLALVWDLGLLYLHLELLDLDFLL